MHTITSWDQSVTILRRFECCYSVFALIKTPTSRGMEPPTLHLSFLPLSVSSIQYPIRTTYNVYVLSWYNSQTSFLYVIQILSCRISWLAVLYTLYILPSVPLSLKVGAFEGEADTSETFVFSTGALLLASVASMKWILEQRFLRDGKCYGFTCICVLYKYLGP